MYAYRKLKICSDLIDLPAQKFILACGASDFKLCLGGWTRVNTGPVGSDFISEKMSACFPFFFSCCVLIGTSSPKGVEVGVTLQSTHTTRGNVHHTPDQPDDTINTRVKMSKLYIPRVTIN